MIIRLLKTTMSYDMFTLSTLHAPCERVFVAKAYHLKVVSRDDRTARRNNLRRSSKKGLLGSLEAHGRIWHIFDEERIQNLLYDGNSHGKEIVGQPSQEV